MWTLALVFALGFTNPQDAVPTEPVAIAKEAAEIDRALEALDAAVRAHTSPRPALDALAAALETDARAHASDARVQAWKTRLVATVEDMQQRAEADLFDADSLARVREDVLESRAERALAWLEERARARQATRAEFDYAASLFAARLARAQGDGQAETAARERWNKFVADARTHHESGGASPADFATLREELIASRLERSLGWLEERALARSSTRSDFARVKAALEDRAAAASGGGPGSDELQRLQNALAKLQERAQSGAITREDFKSIAEKLIGKAREAGAPRR